MIIESVASWVKWLFPPEDEGHYYYPDVNQHGGPRAAVGVFDSRGSSSSQRGGREFYQYEWRSSALGTRHDDRYYELDYPPSYRSTAANSIPVHRAQVTPPFHGQDVPGFPGDFDFAVSPTRARRSGSPNGNRPNEGMTPQELAEFIRLEGVVRMNDGKDVIISHPGSGQYSQGFGTSACGLAALNCVKIALEKEREGKGDALMQQMMMRQTTEDIMAICALWNGDAHLEVEEICQIPYFKKDLNLESTYYGRPSIKDFEEMLTQLKEIAGPDQVAAAVITRPPEIIACFIIPSSDRDIFTVFDSHPRPNYPEGAGFIFCSSVEAAASRLNAILEVDHHLFEDPDMEWQAQLLGTFVGHLFTARGVDEDEDGDGDGDGARQELMEQSLQGLELQVRLAEAEQAKKRREEKAKSHDGDGGEAQHHGHEGGQDAKNEGTSSGVTALFVNHFSWPFGAGESQDLAAGASSSNTKLPQQPLPSSSSSPSRQQKADNNPFTNVLHQQLNAKTSPKRLSLDIPRVSDPLSSPDSPLEYLTPDTSNHGDDINDDDDDDADEHRDIGKAPKGDSDNDSLDPRLYAFIGDEDEDRDGDITMYDDFRSSKPINIDDFDFDFDEDDNYIRYGTSTGNNAAFSVFDTRGGGGGSGSGKSKTTRKTPFDDPFEVTTRKTPFDDPFKVTAFSCSICLEEFSIENVAMVEGCQHQFCRECLRQYVITQIEDRKYPILCPVCATTKIGEPFTITEGQIQQLGAPEGTFTIFTELQMLEHAIQIQCRGCKQKIMVDRSQHKLLKTIVCPLPQCHYRWCSMCSQEAPLSGAEHSCDGSAEFEVLVNKEGWKRCPGCQIPVHRIIGCYHMTCVTPGCRTHFCDRCGQLIIKDDMAGAGVDAAVKKHYTTCDLFFVPPNMT